MRNEDLMWCIRHTPKEVKNAMESLGPKVSIGGGFIRSCITGDKLNDIDMFVDSKDTRDRVVEMLKGMTMKVVYSKNAYTLITHSTPIQVIFRWLYPNPSDILRDFDFTISCAVMWFDNGVWVGKVHGDYYQDLAAKRLVYTYPNRDEDAGGSALRVLKYYRKGYNITLNSYAGVISRLVSGIRNDGGSVVTDEKERAKILTGLLVEVDPSAVLGSEIVREE